MDSSAHSHHSHNNRNSQSNNQASIAVAVAASSFGLNSNSGEECKVVPERVDSAYGTDSNRTASRNTESSGGGGGGGGGGSGGFFFPLADKSPVGSAGSPLLPLNTSCSPPSPFIHSGHHSQPNMDRSGGSSSLHNRSGSSVAFNNETYMSIENASLVASGDAAGDASYVSVSSPLGLREGGSHNNTYQSVHPLAEEAAAVGDINASQTPRGGTTAMDHQGLVSAPTTMTSSTPLRPQQQQQQQNLLKRSPVLKDVTATSSMPPTVTGSKAGNEKTPKERLHAPLTIIIPNISHQAVNISKNNNTSGSSNNNNNNNSNSKSNRSSATSPDEWSDKTISLDILNPESGPPDISGFSGHDYENLALVNINRAPLGGQHWRTYSDMATGRHDDSTKYEKNRLNFTSSSEYR